MGSALKFYDERIKLWKSISTLIFGIASVHLDNILENGFHPKLPLPIGARIQYLRGHVDIWIASS